MEVAVVVLLYNRPVHSIKVFESLVQNGIYSCLVYMDRAADTYSINQQEIILDYLEKHNELGVELIQNTRRLGVAGSVIHAVSKTLKNYDGIIFLEDDCVIRPSGINYFINGLNYFREDKRIRSICGYRYPSCDFKWGNNEELLLLKRFCPWGWATWADRWKSFNPDLREVVERSKEKDMEISSFAPDLSLLCQDEDYLNGKRDIWTINWILEHFLSSTYCVYPRESLIENIGFDGTGQHCVPTDVFDQSGHISILAMRDWSALEYYSENERILREFMAVNSLKAYTCKTTK